MNLIEHLKKLQKKIYKLLYKLDPTLTNSETIRLDDSDLLKYHTYIHNIWLKLSNNEEVKDWNKSKVRIIHTMLVRELIKRNKSHVKLSDLDDFLPSDLKNKTKGYNDKNEK